MSRDRFTEKDKNGKFVVRLSEDCQMLLEYSETVNNDGSKTCSPVFVSAPFVDRLAEYESLVFSPYTLRSIIQEWKEWADAKNDGRLQILPVKPGGTLYQINGPCLPGFGICPYDGGHGTFRCGKGEEKCGPYIDTVKYGNPMLDRIGEIYFTTMEEAEAALEKRYGKKEKP